MKTIPLLTFLALTVVSFAQEPVEIGQARNIATKLEAALGTIVDPAIVIDPDVEKPTGVSGGPTTGAMLVPDKKLNGATFSAAGAEVTPVAQLWLYNVALTDSGARIPVEKLRTVTVANDGKEVDVHLFLLGLGKSSDGALQILVFGKDKEPLLRLPIIEASGEKAAVPFTATVEKTGESSATVTVVALGSYRFVMTAMKP